MSRQVNGHLGTFSTIAELTAKFPPSEHIGCSANVGTTAPYVKAWCDGVQWAGFTAAQVEALGVPFYILNGAVAGQDSGWLPLVGSSFRLAYALDSGTTTTTFSVDISADGATSLGQAFTGTWASSTLWEDTGERTVSNVNAVYFRFNVLTGGPLSVKRLA